MSGRALETTSDDFVRKVLHLTIDYDIQDSVCWSRRDGDLVPFVICNDLFYWGCADGQDITPENISELKKAMDDCDAIPSEEFKNLENLRKSVTNIFYGEWLFCARMRKMRPQGAQYSILPKEIWHLFDECGPERKTGFGNPYAPGEYMPKLKKARSEEE